MQQELLITHHCLLFCNSVRGTIVSTTFVSFLTVRFGPNEAFDKNFCFDLKLLLQFGP
jgi:hypothetical protein